MRPAIVTEAQFTAMQQRVRGSRSVRMKSGGDSRSTVPSGVSRHAPYKSKWEAAYAAKLDLEQKSGAIKGWLYEPFSFKLATGKRYRVDFVTWGPQGTECIEVKGFRTKNRRDGLTHLHWAAQRFPFMTWRLVWRENGAWNGEFIVV